MKENQGTLVGCRRLKLSPYWGESRFEKITLERKSNFEQKVLY